MVEKVAIHWFRQDLRLSDNPALALAAKQNKVLPLYILNEEISFTKLLSFILIWIAVAIFITDVLKNEKKLSRIKLNN